MAHATSKADMDRADRAIRRSQAAAKRRYDDTHRKAKAFPGLLAAAELVVSKYEADDGGHAGLFEALDGLRDQLIKTRPRPASIPHCHGSHCDEVA